MDAHLMCIDYYPNVLFVEEIDTIVRAFSTALKEADGNASGSVYPGDIVVVSRPIHDRRTLSRFYMLITRLRGLGIAKAFKKALSMTTNATSGRPDLTSRNLSTWKIDMARYREICHEKDDGHDIKDLFQHFQSSPPDEHVTFYFSSEITEEQKTTFEQVVNASFRGEQTPLDFDSDDLEGCFPTSVMTPSPHAIFAAGSNFDVVKCRWGVWSLNAGKNPTIADKDPRLVKPEDRKAILYSLWICWANDEVRFKFTHGGLRCRDSPIVGDLAIPDGANFWFAMEKFPTCYGRESRRLMWKREYGLGDH